MTRAQEILIRGVAATLRGAADTLMSLVAREEPKDAAPKCPGCGSTDLAEAGDALVCADCNTNVPKA
jgi:ribosomal protein S27AE